MTGAEVRVDRPVSGDLVAAAGRIHVDQPVEGDAVLGAGSIDVQAPVGEDLRAAGGIVTLAGRVQGEVLIAAARIILSPVAEVHGQTWLAGANISLGGRSLSAVKVYARRATIEGEVYGPLEISADHIEIGSSARIYGDLTYSGAKTLDQHPNARVAGKVTRADGRLEVREPAPQIPGLKPMRPFLLAALFGAGVLLHLVFPAFAARCVRTLGRSPARSMALGSALLFGIPPVTVLLIITIIGIPVGLALAMVYALALLVGYLVSAFFIAGKLAQAFGRDSMVWRYVWIAAGLTLLALAASIPYLGVLVLLLAISAGMGALLLQRFQRRAAPRVTPSPDDWTAT